MPNVINYASKFERQIEQQYARESFTADFESNKSYKFINAKTIQIGSLTLSGYKDHKRDGSKNRGTVSNKWTPYALAFDRDVEFYVDDQDVDETNLVVSTANIAATFNTEQAIPETDKYRFSKLYAEAVAKGSTISNTALTVENFLTEFDNAMAAMTKAGVPKTGRKMKVTTDVYKLVKQAKDIQRVLNLGGNAGKVDRNVYSLDEVDIQEVTDDRMMTNYDFTEGAVEGATAKQINFILYHNSAIIAPVKVSEIYLWVKGKTPETAYGHLYQDHRYHDLFVIEAKAAGVYMNVEA